ncbi:HAMP domain-containing histidine kinase [Paenibacillus sp. N1-5-1-14]|uniref:HAMP domain-containing sensor histidine kinase n=1 Tax=Paenibacillus radicibacter TaxID=2972488 RepID=UPI00215943B1|nr:HAMP domain-containing sensor histidine kinase [Paenibacillus radicibacter]MCR8641228.1 HAMP domain-containing histidine kinase [Paenibacillus radicibacter]
MKIYANPEVKRGTLWLLVVVVLLGASLTIGLWKIEHLITQNYVQNNAAIVGSLLEKHPNLEADLIPLITKGIDTEGVERGEVLLKQYGYDAKLPITFFPSLNTIWQQLYMYLGAVLGVFVLLLFALFLKFSGGIFARIRELTRFANHVLEGNYGLTLPETKEGDFSKLIHSFNRMRLAIQRNIEDLVREKQFLVNLMSDISHQLKTPLASLTMNHDILEERELTKEQQAKFMTTNRQQLERMNWLIQSLLKLAKLDVGAIVFQRKRSSLNQTIYESVEMLRGIAKQKNVQVVIDAKHEMDMEHDKEWLMEALTNMIKNGIEHTASGGQVYVSLEENKSLYKIHIRDEGEGIARDELPYIFNRFYKGKKNKKSGSVGIGLSLSKSIVEGHHGYIDVQSVVGKGTVFTFVFAKVGGKY